MNRDKQNEYYELERLLRVRKMDIEKQGCDLYSLLHKTENEEQSLARYLIDCGYCKSTEVAEEIFAEIDEIFERQIYESRWLDQNGKVLGVVDVFYAFECWRDYIKPELKKNTRR